MSLWHDNWHYFGPLVEYFGCRVVYDLGLPDDATVSTILNNNNQWSFPITQTWELNEIRANLPTLNPHMPPNYDSCKWTLTQNGVFSISSLWEQLRTKFPLVSWNHIVWFPSHIPKGSLITWIAIQNRLSTEDRLVLFGIKNTSCCSFCFDEESHDHLFFNCPFTKQVWADVCNKSQLTWQSQSLSNLVTLLSATKGKGLKSTLAKLSFTVSLYHIWIERNFRKFQGLQHSSPSIVAKICTDIRYRMLSLHRIPQGPIALLDAWNLPTQAN